MKTNNTFMIIFSALTLVLATGISARAADQGSALEATVCPHSYRDPDCVSAKEPIKHMKCTGVPASRQFEVDLDPNSFAKGSGYYQPLNANLLDGYLTASFTCQGYTADNLSCVGYLNSFEGNVITEVKTISRDGRIYASYQSIKGNGPQGKDLECQIN